MESKKNSEFKYSFRGINRIVEERGNQFIRFAQIAWKKDKDEECEPNEIKYDLRKYTIDTDGKERMLKGVSFFSEEGPNELTHILLEEGFGNTEKIIDIIKTREDFKEAVESSYGIHKDDYDDGTFDLREIIK